MTTATCCFSIGRSPGPAGVNTAPISKSLTSRECASSCARPRASARAGGAGAGKPCSADSGFAMATAPVGIGRTHRERDRLDQALHRPVRARTGRGDLGGRVGRLPVRKGRRSEGMFSKPYTRPTSSTRSISALRSGRHPGTSTAIRPSSGLATRVQPMASERLLHGVRRSSMPRTWATPRRAGGRRAADGQVRASSRRASPRPCRRPRGCMTLGSGERLGGFHLSTPRSKR